VPTATVIRIKLKDRIDYFFYSQCHAQKQFVHFIKELVPGCEESL